jgi:SWI/SNF-related matrix-associated actin-dependent regulator of chromatin subfamily A member 5
MVVQQGRLKEKDKVSKEEMMAAIRFGADNVFRSEESTITDEDIDIILERGKAKTKELTEKIQKAEKGDLLDFRLDAGISAQTFEGVDYSDKELRTQLRLLAHDSLGKRERRPPPTNYNPIMAPKKSMIVNNQRIKLPRTLRLPQMEDHHFYNRERLLELGRLEFENYATLREIGQLPPREYIENTRTLLEGDLGEEKVELLAEGFGDWTRSQYYHFVKAAAKFGRDDIASIAADMDMSEEAIAAYSAAFWKYGPTELKNEEWERVESSIERGEKKIAKRRKLTSLLTKFVSTFENPREEMVFANKGTTHFSLEQDRALLCAVNEHGYGNWDSIREELRTDKTLLFQHMVQGMNTDMIAKRVDYRMRQMEKEYEAREKVLKSRKPPNVVAAEKAIEAIREMEEWETEARACLLRGGDYPSMEDLSGEARQNMVERLEERQPMIDRLREIEIQVRGCKELAEETRQAILRGDQYVNYSSITLKAGGPGSKESSHLGVLKGANGEDIEARICRQILKVPQCGRCLSCADRRSRLLCAERLKVRKQLLTTETKKMELESKKGKGSKKRKHDAVSPPRPTKACSPKMGNSASAKSIAIKKKPRVTSQGNKRMSIPEELFPEFCRLIGATGTAQRMKLINDFVEKYPDVSVRQVRYQLFPSCSKV